MMKSVFPMMMIIGSIAAAIVYAGEGDLRRTIYWAAAATLTAAVTF